MSADCDSLRGALGAYVLGALDLGERADVETHLVDCPACREELATLAGLPGLLGLLDLADAEAAGSTPPETGRVLERTLAELTSRRHRHRRRVAAAAAAALIAGGAVGATVAVRPDGRPAAGALPAAQTVRNTDPGTGVSASAAVQAMPWGTTVQLSVGGVDPGEQCQLVAVARDGHTEIAGSWKVTYNGQADITGATAISRDDLTALRVVTLGGDPLVTVPVARPGAGNRP